MCTQIQGSCEQVMRNRVKSLVLSANSHVENEGSWSDWGIGLHTHPALREADFCVPSPRIKVMWHSSPELAWDWSQKCTPWKTNSPCLCAQAQTQHSLLVWAWGLFMGMQEVGNKLPVSAHSGSNSAQPFCVGRRTAYTDRV